MVERRGNIPPRTLCRCRPVNVSVREGQQMGVATNLQRPHFRCDQKPHSDCGSRTAGATERGSVLRETREVGMLLPVAHSDTALKKVLLHTFLCFHRADLRVRVVVPVQPSVLVILPHRPTPVDQFSRRLEAHIVRAIV